MADPKTSYSSEHHNSCRVYRSTSPPSRNLTPCTSASFVPVINSTNIHTKKQHEEEKVAVSCCPEYFNGQQELCFDVPDYKEEKMLKKMPIKTE